MTDYSNFVLRYVINNATGAHAAGRAESGVFNEGGFKWTTTFEQCSDDETFGGFSLRCDVDHKRPWKCEVEVFKHSLLRSDGTKRTSNKKQRCSFNNDNTSVKLPFNWNWNRLIDSDYIANGSFTAEFKIRIIVPERPTVEPGMFATPNKMSKVVLKIGDKKLHVFKELLALHSPVFETMFFGDFAEKGKEEVEIKDAIYQEFIELLNVIYCETNGISDFTVSNILKLADRFQMNRIMTLCENYLKQSTGFNEMKKLIFADQYRLAFLRDHCLGSFSSATELTKKLKSFPEYDNLFNDMKSAICNRIVELS